MKNRRVEAQKELKKKAMRLLTGGGISEKKWRRWREAMEIIAKARKRRFEEAVKHQEFNSTDSVAKKRGRGK